MTCTPDALIPADLLALLQRSPLQALTLGGRTVLPIVQGGMGVGVSGHRLAGTVAALGGVGTLSSVDLRRHHPDLMARTTGLPPDERAKAAIDAANLEAIDRDIQKARALSGGRGLLAINIMRAVSAYAASVKQALASGIDAIVIEHPRLAGGHLGAAKVADLNDPRFDFERVIPEALAFFRSAGLEKEIPLIAAGGIRSLADIQRVQALGAAGVQLGTPFAVTTEGDAHPEFKRVLAEARDDDMAEFVSVAGLPARAVRTPWLNHYLRSVDKLQAVAHAKSRCTKAFDCLAQCGLRDGLADWGQFCIDHQLAAALRGDVKKGLFFRGAGALPFGDQVRSVRELMERLLVGPSAEPAAATRHAPQAAAC